jgi:hypothetical protein
MFRWASIVAATSIGLVSSASPAFADIFTWNRTVGLVFAGVNTVDDWTIPDPIPPLALGNSYQFIQWLEPMLVEAESLEQIEYDPKTEYITVDWYKRTGGTAPFPQKATTTYVAAVNPEFGYLFWDIPGEPVLSDPIDLTIQVDWYWANKHPMPEPGTMSLLALGLFAMARRMARAATH